ncbi:DUF4834 family protein [Algibacter pacificus]|uniref:DUF4834 family protein n=1 Tax=Algibacter pacificus TaxID=2599389 RepID=UPI0011C93C24|nr:DUF4834 family protein [Algibacter pacificus]
MGLLRTIFIIVLVYYLFKVLSRIFAPFLMKFAAKKAEERFGGQFQRQQPQEPIKKEGEVTIDKIPNTKTSNKDVGDYVDYEEVD